MNDVRLKLLPLALAQIGVVTFSHALAGSYHFSAELFPVTALFFPPKENASAHT